MSLALSMGRAEAKTDSRLNCFYLIARERSTQAFAMWCMQELLKNRPGLFPLAQRSKGVYGS